MSTAIGHFTPSRAARCLLNLAEFFMTLEHTRFLAERMNFVIIIASASGNGRFFLLNGSPLKRAQGIDALLFKIIPSQSSQFKQRRNLFLEGCCFESTLRRGEHCQICKLSSICLKLV